MFDNFVDFVRDLYQSKDFIPLHEPKFVGNEEKYVLDAVNSTNVSSSKILDSYISKFENAVSSYTGASYAVATNNGTSALHASLVLSGVQKNCEVLTQSLTFVATCNAIKYCNAYPVFIDVDKHTLNLSPESLEEFLVNQSEIRNDGFCWNKKSNRKIISCMPMHTFGFPAQMDKIKSICKDYKITLIEDSAESLGSKFKDIHTGNFGRFSAVSFNGNKIVTTGGGGMILCHDEEDASTARRLVSTGRTKHDWLIEHDLIAYNYRLPNLNAALGFAQIEGISSLIKNKRFIAKSYQEWGMENDYTFFKEGENSEANYWLNVLITSDIKQRDIFLEYTNKNNIMTRPAWTPMHMLKMFRDCQYLDLSNTEWLFERIVNVPSSVNI